MMIFFLWIYLVEKIPEEPFAYAGNSAREVIVFDQEKAPYFDEAYARLVSCLPSNASEQEILSLCNQFVCEELFDQEHAIAPDLPVGITIPLEHFLENKQGVCRHYALTTTLLVDKLIKQGWLEGEAFLIREETPSGRHAWTLFLSANGAWHLDPYWGFLKNGKEKNDYLGLCQKYGKQTMERQKNRWSLTWK